MPDARVSQQAIAIAIAESSSIMTVLVVAGRDPWSGPVLLRVTREHGIHVADVPVVLLWLFAMYCCWVLWRRGEPGSGHDRAG